MDEELLTFLRDKTEMGRLGEADIRGIFVRMEAAGWRVVRDRQAQATAVDGSLYDAALAAEIARSDVGAASALEGTDIPDEDAVK